MEAPRKPLLIIFYRNPKLGSVKTRLAATIGEERALRVYNRLARHTRDITKDLPVTRIVFYSESIQQDDIWQDPIYLKALQEGLDLGEKMKNAFISGFGQGYDAMCIIGTDCLELTTATISEAFHALQYADAVIGPAYDGGYYLLGMRGLYPELFTNKQWSTSSVFHDTLDDFDRLRLRYMKLRTLRDIDTEDDLPETWSY